MIRNNQSFRVEYPCDTLIATLILKGHGDYKTICEMDYYSAIMTYLVYNYEAYEYDINHRINNTIKGLKG